MPSEGADELGDAGQTTDNDADTAATEASSEDAESTDGTGTSEDATSDSSSSDSSSSSSSSEDDDEGPKFDLADPDLGEPDCGEGRGEVEFSTIWIANSPEGTVSKIDTQTLVEQARYQVRPQSGGEPSRTSVNLRGDVVVASRTGGVTKIFARQEDCVDDNGTPGVQTSTGKDDVLAWDEEECVAWYTDYSFLSERTIAWTAGEFNEATCAWDNAKVWVGATNDQSNLEFLRLDGETGEQEDSVSVPGTAGFLGRSPYGGAVDANDDLWAINAYCSGTLVHVSSEDLSYELITTPVEVCAYGITIDPEGYVWVGGYQTYSGRYDPESGTWDLIMAQGLGLQADGQGRMWIGAYQQNGVFAVDTDTLQVLSYTPLPTSGQSKGVAVDFFGYVWVVSDAGNAAVRMDPDTMEFTTYTGLNAPYSYSDMTGWGLSSTALIPQG